MPLPAVLIAGDSEAAADVQDCVTATGQKPVDLLPRRPVEQFAPGHPGIIQISFNRC
ncbi:hypothetical protein D3C73_1427340 [compost metagenome]